jgi:hypothetical protein
MRRKRKGHQMKYVKRLQAEHCCGCSILSWEQKKFDNFNGRYLSETLRGTQYEQYLLVPPVCNWRIECKSCGHFLCHDCICALHKALKTDHPDLQDSWLAATMHSSPGHVLKIPLGHCCIMKAKQVKQRITSLSPSMDTFQTLLSI